MRPATALGLMSRGARQIGELASGEQAPVRGGVRLVDAGPFDYAAHFRALSDEAMAVESAEASLRSYERAPTMGAVIGSVGAFGLLMWIDHKASGPPSRHDMGPVTWGANLERYRARRRQRVR
jgi:hypothetical protein